MDNKTKVGRPSLSSTEQTVRINARVPQSVKDSIECLGRGNLSLGVRKMVDFSNFVYWSERKSVPEISAIYLIFSDDGELLYIGQTSDLRKRLSAHSRSKQFQKANAIAFWVETPQNLLIEFESELIESLSPSLNGTTDETYLPPPGSKMPKPVIVRYGHPEIEKKVEIEGVFDSEPLTPRMAKMAAIIACGHCNGVTVMDGDQGYRIYSEKKNSHRKVVIE